MSAKIVLTCDRTLASDYGGHLFLGFAASIPENWLPESIFFRFLSPDVGSDERGAPKAAPYGLRKIEAALLANGFSRDEVAVAHPDRIEDVVSPDTEIVGLTENDPMGLGPATTTFRELAGGRAWMEVKVRELVSRIRRVSHAKIVLGGPGAWQLVDPGRRRSLGIDAVLVGEGEEKAPELFRRILGGRVPEVTRGSTVPLERIPPIVGPAIGGIVEVARGCDRGCAFCLPNMLTKRSMPMDRILHEVRINIAAGNQPLFHAEDVLSYGARGWKVNEAAVYKLFEKTLNVPGVQRASMSHFSISSVAQAPDLVARLSELVAHHRGEEVGEGGRFVLSGQVGVETGSPRLMKIHMLGKPKPYSPEEWPDVVVRAFEILKENYWVPCATLIIGLPGEETKDVEQSTELVERLRDFPSLIIPLFYVDLANLAGGHSFCLDDLRPEHGELFFKCWLNTIRWVPGLFKSQMVPALRGRLQRRAVEFLVKGGLRYGSRAAKIFEKHYGWDLRAMVLDIREGRRKVMPGAFRPLFAVAR